MAKLCVVDGLGHLQYKVPDELTLSLSIEPDFYGGRLRSAPAETAQDQRTSEVADRLNILAARDRL